MQHRESYTKYRLWACVVRVLLGNSVATHEFTVRAKSRKVAKELAIEEVRENCSTILHIQISLCV